MMTMLIALTYSKITVRRNLLEKSIYLETYTASLSRVLYSDCTRL